MLKIRGNRQRFKRFVWKLLGKEMGEAISKFLARQFVGITRKFSADELKPVRLGAAEPFHGQREPMLGMIGNGQHPPREVELFRPQMQQGLFAVATQFPGHPRKGRDTAPAFAHFDVPGGREFLQAGQQFCGEFHVLNYN